MNNLNVVVLLTTGTMYNNNRKCVVQLNKCFKKADFEYQEKERHSLIQTLGQKFGIGLILDGRSEPFSRVSRKIAHYCKKKSDFTLLFIQTDGLKSD